MNTAIIAPIIVAAIIWISQKITKEFIKHSSEHQLLQEAHLAQIKAQLLFMYRHAKDNDNKITTQEMDVFDSLHMSYSKLGGNGFIDTIRDKMNQLEIVDD